MAELEQSFPRVSIYAFVAPAYLCLNCEGRGGRQDGVLWKRSPAEKDVQGACDPLNAQHIIPIGRNINLVLGPFGTLEHLRLI